MSERTVNSGCIDKNRPRRRISQTVGEGLSAAPSPYRTLSIDQSPHTHLSIFLLFADVYPSFCLSHMHSGLRWVALGRIDFPHETTNQAFFSMLFRYQSLLAYHFIFYLFHWLECPPTNPIVPYHHIISPQERTGWEIGKEATLPCLVKVPGRSKRELKVKGSLVRKKRGERNGWQGRKERRNDEVTQARAKATMWWTDVVQMDDHLQEKGQAQPYRGT